MLYHGAASAITPAFLTGDDGRSVQGLVVLLAKMCLQVSRKMCLSAPPDAMCRRWCAKALTSDTQKIEMPFHTTTSIAEHVANIT